MPCSAADRSASDLNLDRIAICRECEHRCRIPYRICCDLILRDDQPCSTAWSQAVRAGQCPDPEGNRFTLFSRRLLKRFAST